MAASAFAVESANVVGYDTGTTVDGYNFVGIPFVNIGYNTADIQQLAVDGAEGWGGEVLEIWNGDPAPVAGYTYLDPANDPAGEATEFYWGDGNSEVATFVIQPGQTAVLSGFSESLSIRALGEVSDASIIFETVDGYNIIANSFAAPLSIQNIAIEGAEGWGGEVLEVWNGDPSPTAGFTYLDPANDPAGEATNFYWGDGNSAAVSFSIQPHVGVVLSGFAEGLSGTITAPYTL